MLLLLMLLPASWSEFLGKQVSPQRRQEQELLPQQQRQEYRPHLVHRDYRLADSANHFLLNR